MDRHKYFKRQRKNLREGECSSWGDYTCYYETSKRGLPLREIQVYENGNRLQYDLENESDDYGHLRHKLVNFSEYLKYQIKANEFQKEWLNATLKQEHKEIIELISQYLIKNYDQRFGQALFNLGITEFADKMHPDHYNYLLRDIHADTDKSIIARIKSRLNIE
ncbi:hypothetical protein [Pontimicrobium sp. MEBiC01747]